MAFLAQLSSREHPVTVARVVRLEHATILLAFLWVGFACASDWASDPDYFHGWFVIPLALVFLARRLAVAEVGEVSRGGSSLAYGILVGAAIVVFPLELGRLAPLVWRVFPWGIFVVVAAASLASAYLLGGCRWMRQMVFPLVFLATGVPWPTLIEQPLTMGLMGWIAGSLADLLPVFGIPSQRDGNTIVLLNCTVGVEEACSGVRSMQSALMLALAAGEIFSAPLRSRLLIIVLGLGLAIGSNFLRTFALTLAGVFGGPAAMDAVHDGVGLVAILAVALGIFLLGWMLRRPEDAEPVRSRKGQSHTKTRRHEAFGVAESSRSGCESDLVAGDIIPANLAAQRGAEVRTFGRKLVIPLVIAVLGSVLAHGWYFWNEQRGGVDNARRIEIAAGGPVQSVSVPRMVAAVLNADEEAYGVMRLADGRQASGFDFFWDDTKNNAPQLYHRPDSCMPGGGWELIGSPTSVAGLVGDQEVLWTALPYERRGQRAVLLWAAWLDGEPIPFSESGQAVVQRNAMWDLIVKL